MGKNKLAKFAELATFTNVFQVPYSYDKRVDFEHRGKWHSAIFGNRHPIVLELGCGKGEYTVQMAVANPFINCIGVDIKGARIHSGAKAALNRELNNVAFIRTSIEGIDRFFGPGEIDEIWLTFPDPQMKQIAKRLTSPYFLKQYLSFLKPGGVVHLKTDSRFMYNYTRALVKLNNFAIVADTDNLYDSEWLNDTLRITTFYEKQWVDRGIRIKYLAFCPFVPAEWKEPKEDFEKDDYRSFGRSARE